MNLELEQLIEHTKEKFGLNNYYLARHSYSRKVNLFNQTIYTLCMEWFPNDSFIEDDDSNPDGTAVIDIRLDTRRFQSAIFVMGTTYAKNGVNFASFDETINWIEQETGLTYEKHFQLHKKEEGALYFKACINGITVIPSGMIDIKFNEEGNLTSFSVFGEFPTEEMAKIECYSLSLEKIEHLVQAQIKLIEFPSEEQKKLIPVYALEEIFVTNDGSKTIPFEAFSEMNAKVTMNETMKWDEPITTPFIRKTVNWLEELTAEQAFTGEVSPDSFAITTEEQSKCLIAVQNLLQQEYPKDSGKWVLKSFHRNKGYIYANLRASSQANRVFKRKLLIIIDGRSFQAINYMDNELMLKMYDDFEASDQVLISKEEAIKKLMDRFELTPGYVYDFGMKQYVLCGKLDCDFGVNAASGEVILLDDL